MAPTFPFICWKPDRVSHAVTLLAKLGEEKAHYFLATHSPIDNILGEKGFERLPGPAGAKALTEETLYKHLLEAWARADPDRDVSVLVYGEAGTGKSHLINWLKLRCDYDLETRAVQDVIPILVRRRSGSLKDALTQLIDQLGPAFGKYLQPVKDALGRLSPETATQKLALELALELGPRRKDRGRKPLAETHPKLRHLDQACKQRGFGGWLCRSAGVLARNVRLLTEESAVEERDARPRFTEKELRVTAAKYTAPRDNIEDVLALLDDFVDDSSGLSADAAALLNEALDLAIGEMTGLAGGNLDSILARIRTDLQDQGKRLALFLEDVSAMSVLDIEVIKAVEPRNDPRLCPVLAVMGVTDVGMERLRDNDRQRVTHAAAVGKKAVVGPWAADAAGLARFSARYLNAIRLPEDQVRAVAERRKAGGDVAISACTDCPARKKCFEAFGSVSLDGVEIGVYPFSPPAPAQLLGQLIEDSEHGVSRTPRGFLMHVFNPVIRDDGALERQEFPRPDAVSVVQGDPPYWTAFLNQYCGGWHDADLQRLRHLARFWISSTGTAADAAAGLEPFRRLLGFPDFTARVRPKKDKGGPVQEPPPPPPPPPPPENRQLTRVLENLRTWVASPTAELADDRDVRLLLAGLVRDCVPWNDYATPPLAEWKRLLIKGGTDRYEYVYVEGQRSQPAASHFFLRLFPRTEETRALIEGLARFKYEGRNSWDIPGGELHKRIVARWLRAHQDEVVRALQPPAELPRERPLSTTVELLALAAHLRRRGPLPEPPAEILEDLLVPLGDGQPVRVSREKTWARLTEEQPDLRAREGQVVTLTKDWHDLAQNLFHRHEELCDFLRSELDVPQGRDAKNINFIDPLPVVRLAADLRRATVTPAEGEYQKNFWQTRFTALASSPKYARLEEVLRAEQAEVRTRFDAVCKVLTDAGYDATSPRQAVEEYLNDVLAVIESKRTTKFLLPDPVFDDLVKSQALRRRAAGWGSGLEKARAVADGEPSGVLQYDPRPLLDLETTLQVVAAHLKRLLKELDDQDKGLSVEGDPDAVKQALFAALDEVSGQDGSVAAAATEAEDDEQTERAAAAS